MGNTINCTGLRIPSRISTLTRLSVLVTLAALSLTMPRTACAQPTTPSYFGTLFDAVTGDNAYLSAGNRYWDVDAGADRYQDDFYERPTAQTYTLQGGRYGASEYYEYLDVVSAGYGYDQQFFYVSIDLFGRNKSTSDGQNTPVGLTERYGFRISQDVDGRNGYSFYIEQPETANSPNTTFGALKTFGFVDTDGDVGGRGMFLGGPTGRSVTRSDNNNEGEGLNGYNSQIISDGRLGGQTVLWGRLNPSDNTVVELALDYVAMGWTPQYLNSTLFLEFDAIKGGQGDPQNSLFNDKYTNFEAGSPNHGGGDLSEFGTPGLGNVYALDTISGHGLVPEPSTMVVFGTGILMLLGMRRRRAN